MFPIKVYSKQKELLYTIDIDESGGDYLLFKIKYEDSTQFRHKSLEEIMHQAYDDIGGTVTKDCSIPEGISQDEYNTIDIHKSHKEITIHGIYYNTVDIEEDYLN